MENFKNIRGLKGCKWSNLDAPGKVVGWLGGSALGHIGEVRRKRQLSDPKTDI